MATLALAETMDAMAEALIANVTPRVYAYPTESVTAPCIVIGYPEEINFDFTFDRGSDQAIFPVYYIAGRVSDRSTRDALSEIISGTNELKDALDGDLNSLVNSCTVGNADIEEITIGGVSYASIKFQVTVIS